MQTEQAIFDLLHADPQLTTTECDARRKEPRVPQEPALVRIATDTGDFTPIVAQIANLSKSGIGLRTSKPLPVSPGMSLVVEVRSFLVTGIVRYCVRSGTGKGPYDLGLEITSVLRIQ